MIRLLKAADLPFVLQYLERHHLETTFLIGNVLDFGLDNDQASRRCGDYYGYFSGGILRGIIAFYNLGSCMPHYEDEKAAAQFADLLKQRPFEFLLGMEHVVTPLCNGLTGAKKPVKWDAGYFCVNRYFRPVPDRGLMAKDASELTELDAITFIIEAYRLGFQQERCYLEIRQMLRERQSEEDYLFLYDGAGIVAQACIQVTTGMVNQIGGVFTMPAYRGKGYCQYIVSQLCERIIARGKLPVLIVKKDNKPAIEAYRKVGFEHYADYILAKFGQTGMVE